MPFLIVGIVVIPLLIAFYCILLWAFRKAFFVPRHLKTIGYRESCEQVRDEIARDRMLELAEELVNTPCERVTITSHDGLTLVGRYYRNVPDESRLEILFHGWRSIPARDGCGGAKIARDLGFNQLIVDQRAHGASEGKALTFGIKERYDCLDWVNYTVNRFGKDVKILLGGVSMGAATVLMAADLPLPENVVGITGDCGYSSPEEIIRKVCLDMGIPDRLGYPIVNLSARLFCGVSLKDAAATESLRHARVPVMLMHGEEDGFVPYSMALKLYDACNAPRKKLLSIPRAGHGLSFFYDNETYCRELGAFKLSCFSGIWNDDCDTASQSSIHS